MYVCTYVYVYVYVHADVHADVHGYTLSNIYRSQTDRNAPVDQHEITTQVTLLFLGERTLDARKISIKLMELKHVKPLVSQIISTMIDGFSSMLKHHLPIE
jgi:hypothetical protein